MIDVDILPASTKSSGGDSVLIRIGQFSYNNPRSNKQKVILIDGGYVENAERIENHLNVHYNTDTIDLVIISHPDMDHIAGFAKLLDNGRIKVKKTFIHDPWKHAHVIFQRTQDGRRTTNSIKGKFEDTLKKLSVVLDVCDGVNTEPFGLTNLPEFNLKILGPSKETYRNLLLQFEGMEKQHQRRTISENIYTDERHHYTDSVRHFLDAPITSAKNDTSTVILLQDSEQKPLVLFTGDVGVDGLSEALAIADENKIGYQNVSLFQIPHHGSVKNLNAHLLDKINPKMAYVSAPPENPDHPSAVMLNGITQQKKIPTLHVMDTNGVLFRFENSPTRPGWDSTPKQVERFSIVNLLKKTFAR